MSALTTLAGLLLAADAKLNATSAAIADRVQVRSERKAAKVRQAAHVKQRAELQHNDVALDNALALIRRRADQAEQQARAEHGARQQLSHDQLAVALSTARKHDTVRDVAETHSGTRKDRAATLRSIKDELSGV